MPSEAQVEINTDLARRLQDIDDKGRERKFVAPAPRKKRKRKKKNKDAKSQHTSKGLPANSVLGKNSVYAQNGSDYLRAEAGRGVYRNFSHKHLGQIRELARKAAEFPEGPPQNFDRRPKDAASQPAGSKWPYPWEAHHLLPGDAFTLVEAAKGTETPIFTTAQYDLLLRADYDINHGHNIIMLPTDNWAVPIHVLLQHPSDHPDYTQAVITKLKEIAKTLQELIDQKKPHEELEAAIFQDLKGLEDDFWRYIVRLSKAVVNAVVEGQEFVNEEKFTVRFSKKDGETAYKWGALY